MMTPDAAPSLAWNDQPLDGMVKTELVLLALPRAASLARRHTRAVLLRWHLTLQVAEIAELLACELVTNAVRHTATAGGMPGRLADTPSIALTLRYLARHLIIEVADPDPRAPVLVDADPDAENGRGLTLVDALSSRWGYFPRTSGGKSVFCVIDLLPPTFRPVHESPVGGRERPGNPRKSINHDSYLRGRRACPCPAR